MAASGRGAVVHAPQRHREARRDLLAQRHGDLAFGGAVEVDMGVEAADGGQRLGRECGHASILHNPT